jgi:hypothetical protein
MKMDIHALDYSNNYIKNQHKNTKRSCHYGFFFFLLQGHSCQFLYFNKRKTYLPLISMFMIFFISRVNILFFYAQNDGKNNYTLKLIFNDQ